MDVEIFNKMPTREPDGYYALYPFGVLDKDRGNYWMNLWKEPRKEGGYYLVYQIVLKGGLEAIEVEKVHNDLPPNALIERTRFNADKLINTIARQYIVKTATPKDYSEKLVKFFQ